MAKTAEEWASGYPTVVQSALARDFRAAMDQARAEALDAVMVEVERGMKGSRCHENMIQIVRQLKR